MSELVCTQNKTKERATLNVEVVAAPQHSFSFM